MNRLLAGVAAAVMYVALLATPAAHADPNDDLTASIRACVATYAENYAFALGDCIDQAVTVYLGSASGATINTGILGTAVDGGVNTGILGEACGEGSVNTGILGSAGC